WSSLLLLALAPAAVLAQNAYQQTNLVSDLPQLVGNDPNKVDPNLVNPWGISRGPNTPFWVSDNGTGVTSLYNGAGNIIPRVFTIPPPPGSPAGTTSAPTGQVFNGSSNFDGNFFIFATEDGTIAAWKPADGLTAQIVADSTPAGAIYKGITIAGDHLYAADFHNGRIDVFDSGFNPTTLAGNFRDPNLPTGYAPFNIQNIGDKLYVTYALQDSNAEDDVPGLGHGFIDIFNPDGSLADHFASQGTLNSPGVWPWLPAILALSATICSSATSAMGASMPSTPTPRLSWVSLKTSTTIRSQLTACGVSPSATASSATPTNSISPPGLTTKRTASS